MDAILHLPPALPPHDPAPLRPVPHRIVAEWPAGTFVENVVMRRDDSAIVSVLSEARLDRVDPQGNVSTLRQFDTPTTGIALVDGRLLVAVGEPGAETPVLWDLDPDSGEGAPLLTLEGMTFANGVTPFAPKALLIADSWTGQLIHVDLRDRRVSVWVEDELLTRAPGMDFLPGANGVKRFGDEVTVSSNGRALLLRVAVAADGSTGIVETLAERLRADDMAYDISGRLYLTTHIGHSLDRLDRDGVRVSLGGADEGLAGSTACAFGAGGGLYVTTTGGILTPPGGVLQPAKLVRLDVGATGHPLAAAWESNAGPAF